ncbi:hypothetical protein DRP77_01595 [Candidatus Poribacteria bacterium]|nr:MAG: hypothetical protein DRP77_01595 [Candidatus Poribacteria bacterium]
MSRRETFLCFSIDDNLLAIPIGSAVKVTRMMAFSPIDSDVEGVMGVVNLHGRTAYLLDISPKLGLPPRDPSPDKIVVFLEEDGVLVGVIADDLKGIFEAEAVDGMAPLSNLIEAFIPGDDMIALLNPKAITGMVKP